MMRKFFLLAFIISQNSFADNDIQFKTMLSGGQVEEHVKIIVDSKVICELDAKSTFFGLGKAEDKCIFQPTKKIHYYEIIGDLLLEDEEKPFKGKGKGIILNYYAEFERLGKAKNIDELFAFYNDGIKSLNQELPKKQRLKLLSFSKKESAKFIVKHIKDHGIVLPKDYIKLITKYGYPKNIDNFIPLIKQKSIADVYLDDYSYPIEYVNTHKGVEKNLAFFNDEDVFYVFHNNTAKFCGEPMIDYTIMTEGDYSPIELKYLKNKESCGSFFYFLKNQVTENFIENINNSFEGTYILPVYKNNTLEVDLSYNWEDEDSLEYYFEYNDIFY